MERLAPGDVSAALTSGRKCWSPRGLPSSPSQAPPGVTHVRRARRRSRPGCFAAPNLIYHLKDLAGKKVAILTEGNGTEIQAKKLLDEKGAGADKSSYVATGALPNRLAAITNGQVSGTLLFPPFDLNAKSAGLPKLYDMRQLGEEYPNEVIAASETSVSKNPDALRAFMDALAEASAFIKNNFDKAVTIGAKVTGSPEDQVRASLKDMQSAFSPNLSVSPKSLQSVLDGMKKYSKVKNLPTVDKLYDGSFVKQ